MGHDQTPLLDEFRAWLAGRDEVPPVAVTERFHYSYDDDLDRCGRVVSERRGGEDVRTPLPGPVSTRDVDLPVLRAILNTHPESPFRWEPGELTDAVQRYVERTAPGADALATIVPTIVPTLRAFLRFGATEHPDAPWDLGVLGLEDDLDDAEVLVGLAMRLGGVEHPASARTTRSRAIVTVDSYALDDFRLPLAVRPTVPRDIAQQGAATSAGLAVLRDVVGYVGTGRRVTDNGNLVLADVPRVADLLGVAAPAKPPQSMLDVPAVAFAFRWAVAAGFLVRVNDRVVPGDGATLLTSDPAGACLAALRGLTMVPTLLIPAGRWRALPQDFAPRMLPALLAALYEFGEMPPAELEQLGWHRCTHIYDTASLSDPANEFHRTCVAHDVRHLSRRLALLGIVELDGDVDGDVASHLDSRTIRLTPAGTWALQQLLPEHGYRLPLTGGFDLPFGVLLDRFRDLPTEAVRSELAGWAEHHGADPAEELVRALTQGSPGERAVASYALDALSEQAEPVVRRLLDDPSARPRALSWLTARGLADPPRLTPTAAPDSVVDALAATLVAGDEDGLRDVWLALPDPGSRAALAERLAQASSPHTADVLEGLVGCDPDRRVVKAARRALFKVRCR